MKFSYLMSDRVRTHIKWAARLQQYTGAARLLGQAAFISEIFFGLGFRRTVSQQQQALTEPPTEPQVFPMANDANALGHAKVLALFCMAPTEEVLRWSSGRPLQQKTVFLPHRSLNRTLLIHASLASSCQRYSTSYHR